MDIEKNITHTTFFLLVVANLSLAQPSGSLSFTPSFSAIIVNDIDTSKAWYQEIFDLEVTSEFASEERGFSMVNLGNERFQLELLELQIAIDPTEVLKETGEKTRFIGFFKTGFKVDYFDSWIKHLELKKVQFNGQVVSDPTTNKRMIIVLDPDGNRIQFFGK